MTTINERSKEAEGDTEPRHPRKVSDDLEILFDCEKNEYKSVQRNGNILNQLVSQGRGWTITNTLTGTHESLAEVDPLQPNCTAFQH